MSLAVANLILETRTDSTLQNRLMQTPDVVAKEKQLPALVAEAAARTLRKEREAEHGVWY